ncbi:hypothetical protein PFISCL1PPCAC_17891, partial [Pristionchus fissidentatus]
FLDEVEFYEAGLMSRVASPAKRITIMNVSPFTIDATFEGEFALTVKTSNFDMLNSKDCEYVFQTDDSKGSKFFLQVNSLLISMLVDTAPTTKLIKLTTALEFSYERSIEQSSYASSPGYIGCGNQSIVFRNENYNDYELSGYNETFVVSGNSIHHISFSGDLNNDDFAPVWFYRSTVDIEPIKLKGSPLSHTNSWQYELDTNYFSLFWDGKFWKNATFLIRYD